MNIYFQQASNDDRIAKEIILPGLILILREVFPNVYGWRYSNTRERRDMIQRCAHFFTLVLQDTKSTKPCNTLLKKTCVYSLLHTENALELLKFISVGMYVFNIITSLLCGSFGTLVMTECGCVCFGKRIKTCCCRHRPWKI